jgi:hypothetical protein
VVKFSDGAKSTERLFQGCLHVSQDRIDAVRRAIAEFRRQHGITPTAALGQIWMISVTASPRLVRASSVESCENLKGRRSRHDYSGKI